MASPSPSPSLMALWSDSKTRFLLELEFVELLANPWYLQSLAQRKYLDSAEFIQYIDYLQYWRKPEYVHFISHPHALYFLELLQQPVFRGRLSEHSFVELLHNNQFWHWKVVSISEPIASSISRKRLIYLNPDRALLGAGKKDKRT